MSDTYSLQAEVDPSEFYDKYIPRDSRDIKKSLRLEQDYAGVFIFAVAIDTDDYEHNQPMQVPAQFGAPLSEEVHDQVKDVYHVDAVSVHEIGRIPVNYKIYLDDTLWCVDVPLPFTLIKKYMDDQQKQRFEEWRSAYKSDKYAIRFLQVVALF